MKTSNSTDETIKLAQVVAEDLQGGDILLLKGELGSGKTTFVKGVCEHFGISKEDVRSPTFTLMNIYPTEKNTNQAKRIVHVDTYRMDDKQDLIDIGIEEYLKDDASIVLVEWPEKIKDLITNKNTKTVEFKYTDKNKRQINIKSNGQRR